MATLKESVYFVGFMGAGKTTVARRLARMCHAASVDVDAYIERREGKRVKEIFAEEGEQRFRDIEHDALVEIGELDPLLVSCGGGIVLRPENREFLKESGFVVYLQVDAAEAAGRISDISTRPLFKDIEAAEEIRQTRLALYQEVADVLIDTSGKSMMRITHETKDILKRKGILQWHAPK